MVTHRLYYALKPYLPWGLRMGLRRFAAKKVLDRSGAVWPINPAAGNPPAGWPGWPGGKKFAVVLTHDVEGAAGLARCRELAEAETRLGFRSSFNFIPEGSYKIPESLRASLVADGFEVGLHDLRHDGRLYRSREIFRRNAARINEYLREWKAVGFRSGFMYHNLEWLHDLNVEYDASTFDTDPFEPQPDGVDMIFPLWIPRPARENDGERSNGLGYVELPYTLPQDSTLYLLLRQRSANTWRAKLDWIAGRGGMVLVNVHPDYLSARGEASRSAPDVLAHYLGLLDYIQDHYRGAFWHALPREVAAYVRGFRAHGHPESGQSASPSSHVSSLQP